MDRDGDGANGPGGLGRALLLAVVNHKGGVGKTTTSINVATAMAAAGRRVLIVDLDPQGNAGAGLGFGRTDVFLGTYQLVVEGRLDAEMMRDTMVPGMRIISASVGLARAEVELAHAADGATRLRDMMIGRLDGVDVVVFDCPPAVGILARNALAAADVALIPVQCESFALEGLKQILRTIAQVKTETNPRLRHRIALTMRDSTQQLSGLVAREIRAHFGAQVLATEIPREEKVSEASFRGMPVLILDHVCDGARAYIALTREILSWEREMEDNPAGPLRGGGADPEVTLARWAAERGPVGGLERRAAETAAPEETPDGWDAALEDALEGRARSAGPPIHKGLLVAAGTLLVLGLLGAVAVLALAVG